MAESGLTSGVDNAVPFPSFFHLHLSDESVSILHLHHPKYEIWMLDCFSSSATSIRKITLVIMTRIKMEWRILGSKNSAPSEILPTFFHGKMPMEIVGLIWRNFLIKPIP